MQPQAWPITKKPRPSFPEQRHWQKEVIAKLDLVCERFGSHLPGNAQFTLRCLRYHISIATDWADYDGLEAALNACDTAWDLLLVLHGEYDDLLGSLQDVDIYLMAEEMLSAAGYASMPYRAYLPATNADGWITNKWRVFTGDSFVEAESAGGPHIFFTRLDIVRDAILGEQQWSILRVYLDKATTFSESGLLSKYDVSRLASIARRFVPGATEGDIRVSTHAYTCELEEEVAWVWIHTFTDPSDHSRVGDYFLLGLETNLVYHGFIGRGERSLENYAPDGIPYSNTK